MSAAMAAVTRVAPRKSIRLSPWAALAGSRGTSMSMAAISGGLTRNTARQPRYWVSRPPAMIPVVAPPAVAACQSASARLRAGPSGLAVVSSDSAAGEASAADAPCAIRATISTTGQRARPQPSEASAKPARPTASIRRRPSRSASRPPTSSSEPKVSAYPVTIHCSSAGAMPSSRWMVFNATLTMLKSSCSTNWAAQITPVASTAVSRVLFTDVNDIGVRPGEVAAEEEAVGLDDVSQRHRPRRERGAGGDAERAGAGQQRADGQAQLIEQPGRRHLAEQVRAALAEHPAQAPVPQRGHPLPEVHDKVARHDHVRYPGHRGAPVGGGGGAGDHDRPRVWRRVGKQRRPEVQLERAADQRDRRCPGPAGAQAGQRRTPAGGLVLLGARGARADKDHVRQGAQQPEQPDVGGRGQAGRPALEETRPVGAAHHVGAQPPRTRVGVELGQLEVVELAVSAREQSHVLDRSTTMARPATSTLVFGENSRGSAEPRGLVVSTTTSQSLPSLASGSVNVIGSGPALNISRNFRSVTGSPRGSGSVMAAPFRNTATDFA